MVLVDASDPLLEIRRKLETTRREVLERQQEEEGEAFEAPPLQLVLTKIDLVEPTVLERVVEEIQAMNFPSPVTVSSHTGQGIEALQTLIRQRLFGRAVEVIVSPPALPEEDATERVVAAVYEAGMVEDDERGEDGSARMLVWLATAAQAQLKHRWQHRIEIK